MDLTSDQTFSVTQFGVKAPYNSLASDIQCDVLILGGGISGALAAHHLVRQGLNCIVADKRDVAMGSTSASTSILLYELDDPIVRLSKKVGLQKADRVFKAGVEAIQGLEEVAGEIGFNTFSRKKSVYFTGSREDKELMAEEYRIRKQLGFEVAFLESGELMDRYGLVADAAILSEVGGQTDAYLFAHALHRFNEPKMCGVYSKTTIVNLDFQSNQIVATTDAGFNISSKYVIHATGYESQEYLPKKVVDLQSTYVTCGKRPAGFEGFGEEAVFWNSADPYLYIRTADNMIMTGGEDEEFYNPVRRDELLEKKGRTLMKKFSEVFPAVPLEQSYSWCGTFGSTKDGLPYIGSYNDPRNLFLLGFGGNGMVFSQIAAEILSYRIMGKPHALKDHFAFDR